jgi:hypothetical protein
MDCFSPKQVNERSNASEAGNPGSHGDRLACRSSNATRIPLRKLIQCRLSGWVTTTIAVPHKSPNETRTPMHPRPHPNQKKNPSEYCSILKNCSIIYQKVFDKTAKISVFKTKVLQILQLF